MGVQFSRPTPVVEIKIYPTGIIKKEKKPFALLPCCKNSKITNSKIKYVSFKSFREE